MKVAVVGAGITGLTVAHELLKKGHQAVLFDRSHPGGLIAGFACPGAEETFLDRFYHHVFTDDTAVLSLIGELGLADDLVWAESSSAVYAKGRAWPLSGAMDLVRFRPLGSVAHRLLMGMIYLELKRRRDWSRLDGVSCREFFRRRLNATGYSNFWRPMLRQKFGSAADDIAAAFLWGRLHARAKSRRKGREMLGYLRGGFERLARALVDAIRDRGGEISDHDPVERVVAGARPEVISQRREETFDRVVWTIATHLIPKVVTEVPPEVRDRANAIPYVGATCLILVMPHCQGPYYWMNNIDPNVTFGALIEHTNLISSEHYGGQHVLYVTNYHDVDDPIASMDLDDLIRLHAPSLRRVQPAFSENQIRNAFLSRALLSSPVYDVGFADRMPPPRGWLPNVDVCNMTQVYPVDRNMDACVRNARRCVGFLRQ